jgi:hypothetical protein
VRYILLLFAAAALTASCSKPHHHEDTPIPDNGCIERIDIKLSQQAQPALTAEQVRTADSLLDANHVHHDNYRYLAYHQDTLNGGFEQFIQVDQYANGLRLFASQINFVFSNGILYFTTAAPTKGTTLDTIPSLILARLRTLFSGDLQKQELGGSVSYGYRDSCYKAEFGYINIAADGAPEDLIKAWRVSILYPAMTPGHSDLNDEPYAIYKDGNGQLIAFVGNLIIN